MIHKKKIFTLKATNFTDPGRAINLDQGDYDEVTIDSCTFTHTGGIFIQVKPNAKILIQNCTFNEIIKTKGMEYAQAIQISGLDEKESYNPIPISLQILGNKITNTKGIADVEDNINLIMVSGSASAPLHISGNQITGAYPLDLSAKSIAHYSGGGCLSDRGCCFALIERNGVHETSNYGIAVAGGSHNIVRANGVTAKSGNGSGNVGIYCANLYKEKGDPFVGNYVAPSNQVDWMNVNGKRNDVWVE